jgi:hypothetical protein
MISMPRRILPALFGAAAATLLLSASSFSQIFNVKHVPSGPFPIVVKTADVNNDGNLDLLWISGQHNLEVRLGSGDGNFASTGPVYDDLLRSSGGFDTAEFEIADLNHDGKLDFIAAGGQQLSVMLGNGDGTFQPPHLFQGNGLNGEDNLDSLALADFNRDGKIDAVSGDNAGVQLFFGHGDGTFSLPKTFAAKATSVEAGDFDHDGKADVAFQNFCSSCTSHTQLQAWFGDGAGNFPTHKTIFSTNSEGMRLFVKDINKDGRDDITDAGICFTSGCSAGVRTWLAHSDRTFGRHSSFGFDYDGSKWSDFNGMGFGDFNLDGILDLAAGAVDNSGTHSDAVLVFSRTSDGTVNPGKVFGLGGQSRAFNPTAVVAGDFNKDGKADLAIAMTNADDIEVWINATAGSGGGGTTCSKGALYTMHICSPTNGSTVTSPVHVLAQANSDHTISAWKVYVNGTAVKSGTGGSIDTMLSLAPSQYRITVKAWDTAGHVPSATVFITVH